MSDGKPKNDPSMDDILASIRKIISDDEARAAANPEASPAPPLRPLPPRTNTGPSPAKLGDASPEPPPHDDVLLLTNLIDEPPSAPASSRVDSSVTVSAPGATSSSSLGIKPIPSPITSKLMDPNEPQPAAMSAAPTRAAITPVQPPVAPVPPAPPIATMATPNPIKPASASAGPMASSGGKSVEDLVREMLRPMLQEWIDKNAAALVEKHIQQEVERLARR